MSAVRSSKTNSLKSQETKQNGAQNNQNFVKIYKIKISFLNKKKANYQNQFNIYLNLTFDQKNESQIQTQCVDLNLEEMFFEIKSKAELIKIEVLDYDSMKKLSKISLKGINKEFVYTHQEKKNNISMTIDRSHANFEILNKKAAKLSESIILDGSFEKDSISTNNCDSETSI